MSIYDDEIDLRPYLMLLIKHWWQIILCGLVLGLVGLGYSLMLPYQYEATSTILVTRSQSKLSLAEQFPTVNEPIDSKSRMDAILSIAQSDSLSENVIKILSDKLPSNDRNLDTIKRYIKLGNKGDAILITAIYPDAILASEIANTWAQLTVQAVNQAYSSEQPLTEIENQTVSAKQAYDVAQTVLEDFIKNNPIPVLQKKITETQALFDDLSSEQLQRISFLSARKQALKNLQTQADGLLQQVKSGNASKAGDYGNALAILLMRANGLGVIPSISALDNSNNSVSNPTIDLQIDGSSDIRDSTDGYATDVAMFVQLLDDELVKTENNLNQLSQMVMDGQGYSDLEPVAMQLQNLQTQLENAQARQKELTSQRDLTWQAYQAMSQKVTELKNGAQTSNQINIAAVAVPPQEPISRGTIMNTLIAVVLGGIIGIVWVFLVNWWRSSDKSNAPEPPSPNLKQTA